MQYISVVAVARSTMLILGLDSTEWGDVGERLRSVNPEKYVEVVARLRRLVEAEEAFATEFPGLARDMERMPPRRSQA